MLILASIASREEPSLDTAAQETTSPLTGNQTLLQENKKKGGRRARRSTGCSSGWSPLTTGGNTNCYKVFPDARVSWFQAQHLCHHVGANLASIPTPTINFFILKLVISTKTSSEVYIGGHKPTYRSTKFKWAWWGGAENTGYWNWGPGQPIDEKWDNCVSIVPGWGGKWDSLSCNWHKFAYVCEKPA